ncbi:putative G-patch domain-containing protein [Helianthus annuus]|nr:putative G-patch domain-containing protein [Helianthus annuus]
MKVSFSLSSSSKPSNSTSRSSSNESLNNNKEFITHFDPSKPPTDPTIIIPPIPNEWNPQNQPMIIDLPNDPDIETDRLMLMKLKSDLKRLPDDRGFGDFDDVSVEEFARAYMKGYGWYEGRGIGKNTKEDVKVVEFTNRAAGQGLGFVRTTDSDCKN